MNRKPCIWFPTIKANTGADVFTLQLVNGLNKLGYRAEISWLPHHAEYLPWMVRAPSVPSWVDVIHVNSWLPVKFIPKNVPVVSTIHHSVYSDEFNAHKSLATAIYHKWWIKKIERQNIKHSTQVVAVSNDAANVVGAALECKNIQVIYNGVSAPGIFFDSKKNPNKPFQLIYVGSWIGRKGVDLFAPIMVQLGCDFKLIVVGGRPKESERKSYPENISFLGRIENRDQLFNLLLSSDALLFPSRSEGLSIGLIEAQLCGLPAICANYSSMPEVVMDGFNGLICEGGCVNGFVEAVKKLSSDYNLWNKMRRSAHERMKNEFSLDHQISSYTALYEKLLLAKDRFK